LARSQAGSADAPRPRHHRGVVRFLIDECLTVDLVSVAGQFAPDSPLEGAGFEPSVPGRLQAKTPRFGIVLRRLLSSCGSFHIDHRLSCHVSPLIEFTV